jgi:hypothetical protein
MSQATVRLLIPLTLAVLLCLPGIVYGQELVIEPTETGGPYLNEIIAGDTTATGERVDLDRIYVLQRDGIYLTNDDIRIEGFDLRLMTEAGAGARAIVYPVLNSDTGGFPDPIIDMRGNIWVKDVALPGYTDAIPEEVENINSTIVRSNAPGFDLIMDGVIMSNTRGQHIRTEAAARVIRITNSVLANMGDLGRSNFGAGKGIDLRANSIDSLIFRNTTFVNFQDRLIRHRSSTAPIGHLIFDHNTVINGMSYHGMIALGEIGDDAVITNNLFLDAVVAGADSSDAERQAEYDEHTELYPNGKPSMPWIFSVPNDVTQWTVANNYYAVSDEVEAFYTQFGDGGGDDGNPDNGTDGDNDIIDEGNPLSDHILSKPGVEDFIKVDLEVTDRPDVMINMAEWYRTETGRTKETTNFARADDDFDRQPVTYFMGDFDASYPTSSDAYMGATGSCPAGDLNWFPSIDPATCPTGTAIERISGEVPVQFKLNQNYPNPFNPTTNITYDLPDAAIVSLVVYNVLGQEVARLVDGQTQSAGVYRVTWDGLDQSGSKVATGMYFYQLQSGEKQVTKTMILLK